MRTSLFLFGRASSKTVDKISLDKFFVINYIVFVPRMGCLMVSGVRSNDTVISLLGSVVSETFNSTQPIKASLF